MAWGATLCAGIAELALATGSGYHQIIFDGTHGEGGGKENWQHRNFPAQPPCDSVFPALLPVTCGRTVHKVVENPRLMRVTCHILWIACGQ